jgi:hypothetical protein
MKSLPLIAVLCATSTLAQAQNNMCVPRALGVPTRDGPPDWLRTRTSKVNGATLPPNDALDDPRWLGATGQTFALGSAKAPLQARALISTEDAVAPVTKYVYLSFIIDLDAYDTAAASDVTPRDLFLGFHRPGAPAGGERGYVFQFHLTGPGAALSPNGMVTSAPPPCDDYATCDEDASSTPHDYWRVFRDIGNTASYDCSGPAVGGRELGVPAAPGTSAAAAPWMVSQDAVRYWKVSAGDPSPFAQNRWAVQIRLPMVAADATKISNLASGIEEGSTFYYEATGRLAHGPSTGTFAPIGWYPQTASLRPPVCTHTGFNTLVTAEMSDNSVDCPNCQLTHLAGLSDLGLGAPATCDGGIDIDIDHIGVLNTAVPSDPETIGPGTGSPLNTAFLGATPTSGPVINHVIALPVNTAASTIKPHLQARFRLAEWGSAPWSVPGDLGQWADIRGAESGICAKPPTGTDICGESDMAPGKHALLTFDWQIGAGPSGASEYCEFGLKPPGGTCTMCTLGGATGTQAAGGPCVPSFYQFDQCMLVELNSPNGPATFVHQSIWSNMRFGTMSTLAHEALIDARHLPTAPGQLYQDIYFVAVPRNMPQVLPATTTTVSTVQTAALNLALHIAQPYLADLKRQPPIPVVGVPRPRPFERGGGDGNPVVQQILRAREVMPPADVRRVDGLLTVALAQSPSTNPSATLVHGAVGAVGSSTAAELVPTLDIYPYYQVDARGRLYSPMTSFSLFLSHESTLSGIRYQIDGADKVGGNIYHLRIPVGNARKIQVRAQALTANEATLPPGNPAWPCAGGCAACGGVNRSCGLVAALGSGGPGLLACVWVIGRRRKPKRRG